MQSLTLTGAALLVGMLLSGCGAEAGPIGQRLPPWSQVLKISNLAGGTLTWTATSSPNWLKIQPKMGTAPSAGTVSVDAAALPIGYNGSRPGLLQGYITVSATGASNTPLSCPSWARARTLLIEEPAA